MYNSHIIGFRKGPSTQDAMIQLNEQVVDATSIRPRDILGLDLKSALDTAKYIAYLER